jgi:hypothetical protein
MIIDNEFSQDSLNVLREATSKANLEIKKLKQQLDNAIRVHKMWDDLNSYVESDWPQHVLHILRNNAQFFKEASISSDLVRKALDEISQIAKERADALLKRFPAYLEDAAIKHNLPLDRQSKDPRYTFEKGFFSVEIDYQNSIARLSDYEGRLEEFPADIDAIVENVKKEYDRVFGKPFEGDKFLKKLRNQYLAILKKENWPDGYAVPIRHITRRLGKNEEGFRTDVFIIHLSRLVEQGSNEIDGRRLDLEQTKDTNQGILLHGRGGIGGYVGYITFKEVK